MVTPDQAMAPSVSIIIPCYRCEATLCETVRSVLAQTYEDWECILVSDDGNSHLEFLEAHGICDPRLREHPERTFRTGTVKPRNRALTMARGRFIADLDGDDLWAPQRLEHLLPHVEACGLVQDVLELFCENRTIGYSGAPDGEIRELKPHEILAFDFPFHTIVARDLLGSEWFWHDSFVPDVLRAIWLTAKTPMRWVRQPLLKYRVSASSMSQSIEGAAKIDESYSRIIGELKEGTFGFIAQDDLDGCIAGFERKRQLNRRYMELADRQETPPSFLEWVLETGLSGVTAANR